MIEAMKKWGQISFRGARRDLTPFLAMGAMVLLSVWLWRDGATYIEDVSSTLMGIRELVGGDSEHYLAIADALREGNLSMDYVAPTGAADRAHRQPGYPAVIAIAESFGLTGAPDLARVNLAILVASLWIAFFGARIATGSALAGLLAAGVIYDARFLYEIATERLLTEPTYVAVTLGAVAACLSYVGRPGPLSLLLVAALGGLAYLVRVNGLIMTSSIAIALVVADINRARRRNPDVPANDLVLHLPLAAYAAAVALFVVVTIPSWLPRTIHAGSPVYHGYLPNYLWVDEHDRAHAAGPPRFTFETYAAEHGAADAARRMAWGLRRVFWEARQVRRRHDGSARGVRRRGRRAAERSWNRDRERRRASGAAARVDRDGQSGSSYPCGRAPAVRITADRSGGGSGAEARASRDGRASGSRLRSAPMKRPARVSTGRPIRPVKG
jgi:hypothetical protein